MPKIEIELEELTRLQDEKKYLQIELEKHQEYIRKSDREQLAKKAIHLSFKMMNEYMARVFEALGFDNTKMGNPSIIYHENCERIIESTYHDKPRLSVRLEADITTEFSRAFIRIGVLPKKVQEEKADIVKLLTED